jgi:hypothetical protein
MSNPPPSYSEAQLKTLAILTRNNMAVVMFWFMLAVFTAILVAMCVCVLGKIERLGNLRVRPLGWCRRLVY